MVVAFYWLFSIFFIFRSSVFGQPPAAGAGIFGQLTLPGKFPIFQFGDKFPSFPHQTMANVHGLFHMPTHFGHFPRLIPIIPWPMASPIMAVANNHGNNSSISHRPTAFPLLISSLLMSSNLNNYSSNKLSPWMISSQSCLLHWSAHLLKFWQKIGRSAVVVAAPLASPPEKEVDLSWEDNNNNSLGATTYSAFRLLNRPSHRHLPMVEGPQLIMVCSKLKNK
jgi:hypothetical protein